MKLKHQGPLIQMWKVTEEGSLDVKRKKFQSEK